MNVEYGYRCNIKVDFNIDLIKTEDKIHLAQDLLRKLLLTDELQGELHEQFRNFLAKALDESA